MSIHISNTPENSVKVINNLHLMPCKIEYNGEANVGSYFQSSVRDVEKSQMTSSFRGRPLNGEKLKLPAGFTGYVLKENRRPYMEDEDRSLIVTHNFKELTYWNLDKTPSSNDGIRRAMEWIDISESLHSQIDEESSQKSLTGK